jgi:hypothetical protein
MHNKLFKIFLIACLAWPACAAAQSTGVDPVQYIVAPETPGPNAPVTITVQGVGSFLGDATITWSAGGRAAQSGVGLTTFSFTTGGLGTQTVVRVSIDSSSQGLIQHSFTFVPSTVDLVWEADTSVPPLYRGHALYSPGSPLRVVAFPTVIVGGKKVSAASLSYQWTVNDNPVPDASGTGKYTLNYTGDQLQTGEDVAADVYAGSLKVGHSEVVVPASSPLLLLYYKDPLRGVVWDETLPSRIALNGQELTVKAQPYFFANQSLSGSGVTWAWALNGQPAIGPTSNQGVLTLRQSGQGPGSADLSVELQNQDPSQLVQSAKALLGIVFGQATNSFASFFGL